MWQEILGLINDDAPALWMYGGTFTVGVQGRFENVSFPWDEWWDNLWTFRVTPSQYIDRDLIASN